MKFNPTPHSSAAGVFAAACVMFALSSPLQAGTAEAAPAAPVETPAQPIVHFLLQLDFSNAYITPRGLNVENQGLVFQPLLLSFWNLYSNKENFLNDITLTAGVWASVHSQKSGADPGHWNEWDPIAGLSFGLGEFTKFETNYTAFDSLTDSYPTSHHLELVLKVDDSKWLGDFALNPYFAFWRELKNKATVVFDPATSEESYYFTLGIKPAVKLGKIKLEFPNFINIVADPFYQQFNGSDGGTGLAVFCSEIKASVPLEFIPKDYGFWNAYVGFKYYHLSNDGVLDGNEVLASPGRDENLWQVHGGISIFY